jgi:uncharacterized membrane protein YfcA
VSPLEAILGVAAGVVMGVLSGLFGVGGGTVATPAISVIFGAAPIVAVATPLPVIIPTAIVGAATYRRAGEVDFRAAGWMSLFGVFASVGGALLTRVIDARLLLIVTALLLLRESVKLVFGKDARAQENAVPATDYRPWWAFGAIGIVAGLVSGLLGVGGGIIMVPLMIGALRMPLKRALGTSLAAIVVLAIPGTITHWLLGNIDWAIALVLAIGSVAGANLGARLALGARERTLRLAVGSFLGVIAVAYGANELVSLLRSGR